MVDWLFNMQVPESTPNKIIIRPTGKTYITGIASQYDANYNESLNLTQPEFKSLISQINRTMDSYWPCTFCFVMSYLLSPFTLGLSFCLGHQCTGDAEEALRRTVDRENRLKLSERGYQLVFVKGWSTSWLELIDMKISGEVINKWKPE